MANFLVSLFQQLDRAFPLQGVDVAQHSNQRAGVELRGRSRQVGNLSDFDVTGNAVYEELPIKQPDSHWFDVSNALNISPNSGLPMLGDSGVDIAGQVPFQTHNFD